MSFSETVGHIVSIQVTRLPQLIKPHKSQFRCKVMTEFDYYGAVWYWCSLCLAALSACIDNEPTDRAIGAVVLCIRQKDTK